jgi:hypothetical protein
VTVRRDDSGKVVLEGRCPVEDAEQLLQMLQSNPGAPCDLTLCNHLHTAVVQVILAARPSLIGPCGDAWVEQWIVSVAR